MSKNSNHLKFKPARLATGKEWYVEYYFLNPQTGSLERQKTKINHIKNLTERRKYGRHLRDSINDKLYEGWDPYEEKTTGKGNTLLFDATDRYLQFKIKEKLSPDSIRSYTSFITIFQQYLKELDQENMKCGHFKKSDAVDFMDYVFEERDVSGRTFNNYLGFFRGIFKWMIEKDYMTENYFSAMRKMQVDEKERVPIDAPTRTTIKEHLEEYDYNFMVVCMLVFHTLIRPKEICFLKPKHFRMQHNVIEIFSSTAKNNNTRRATIPGAMREYLEKWDFNQAGEDEYIFGKQMLPGKSSLNPRDLSRKWGKLREKLGLEFNMKLYSLRDSGIIQLLQDGVSPEEVMRHADHSSLEMTTKYLKHVNPDASHQVMTRSSKF